MNRTASAPPKTPNSEPRVTSVASWISTPKRRSGLSVPYFAIASSYAIRGNGRAGASRPSAANALTTASSSTSSTSSRSTNAISRSSCRNSNCRSARRSSSRQQVAIW